jgi:hypothetical protein
MGQSLEQRAKAPMDTRFRLPHSLACREERIINLVGEVSMVNRLAAIGLGAVIALSPIAAIAQTTNSAHAGGGGSHSRHLRHSANSHKERARAGAEHMHHMRTGAAPKT